MTRLVPLTVCHSIPQVVVLRSMLRAYGIHTATNAFRYAQLDWYRLVALGGVGIYVLEIDAEHARLLMCPVEGYATNLETEAAAFARNGILNVVIFAVPFLIFGWLIPFWLRNRRFLSADEA